MKKRVEQLVLAAMFLALGIILPQLVKFIPLGSPGPGTILLPMHIPVLLCGFVCGPIYGLAVGFIVPLLTSLLTTLPPIFPVAISMSFELATYGAITGLIYMGLKKQKVNWLINTYISLIAAMLAGRAVMGIVNTILLSSAKYGLKAFIAGAFVSALPGIIIQIVLIPVILLALKKAKFFD